MINQSFLVSADVLQQPFVDKDGSPMANGTITCYSNNNRTTLKNWYYQSDAPGLPNYITLPNPLTLSSAGTICTVGGTDVIPFYYPVSEIDNITPELYYIVIQNQYGTDTITRAFFPYESAAIPSPLTIATFKNYIVNNRLWRNSGAVSLTSGSTLSNYGKAYANSGNAYYVPIAPSQHDGFSMPDINYIKNNISCSESISVLPFPTTTTLSGDITPEFYINHNCTANGTGEIFKVYQFPISLHLNSINNALFTVALQGQCVSGANTITVNLYNFYGTGNASSFSAPIATGTIQLSSIWQKWTLESIFPGSVTIPATGYTYDDAYYLQIGMPINVTCDINISLPSLYLSTDIPTNDFATYDQIDSIISTSRTGDVKTTLNNFGAGFFMGGWLPMLNGTIGQVGSGANILASSSTWPLYNLLWTFVSNPSNNAYAPITGGLGGSALADFNALKPMYLTAALGQVFAGTGTGGQQLGSTIGAPTTSTALILGNMPAMSVALGSQRFGVTSGGTIITGTSPVPTAVSGTGSASPIVTSTYQPTTYMNYFIKL
jgi:hypothetical protein